jgi:hypothetical protein
MPADGRSDPPGPAPAAPAPRRREPPRVRLGLADTWHLLNAEQRVAAIGAILLIVSTLGPFSFVEAAIVLLGGAVLLLLRKRAEGREFHVPFGDGTVIAAAGLWAALLILIRLFDRPPGQGLLALVCAAILVLAGIRERAKRPADDLPPERRGRDWLAGAPGGERDWTAGADPAGRWSPRDRERRDAPTERLWREPDPDAAGIRPADPPEFPPPAGPEPSPSPADEHPPEADREPDATEPLFDDRGGEEPEHPTGAPEPGVPPRRPREPPQ